MKLYSKPSSPDLGPKYSWELTELSDAELKEWELSLRQAVAPLRSQLKRVTREKARRTQQENLPLLELLANNE